MLLGHGNHHAMLLGRFPKYLAQYRLRGSELCRMSGGHYLLRRGNYPLAHLSLRQRRMCDGWLWSVEINLCIPQENAILYISETWFSRGRFSASIGA
jgi:hypothetical protein